MNAEVPAGGSPAPDRPPGNGTADLAAEVAALRAEVADLRARVEELSRVVGDPARPVDAARQLVG